MKKVLAILMTTVLLLCSIPVMAAATDSLPTRQITSIDQLEGVIPDQKFRQVIFDAVENGGDDGTAEGATVEEALGNYQGEISAKNKGIQDAHGLELLKRAELVNLSHNLIEDWAFLEQPDERHYGYDDGTRWNNVEWDIAVNPYRTLPATFGGRLVIEQPATASSTYPEDLMADAYFVRRGTELPTGTLDIGRAKQGGSFVPITTINPLQLDNPDVPSDHPNRKLPPILETGVADVSDDYSKLDYRVLKTGVQKIGIGSIEVFHYGTSDEFDNITPGSQSFKYYITQGLWVYDSLKLAVPAYTGGAVLTKTDKDSGAVLAGASYTLYQKDGTKVQENITTGADGKATVTDLPEGEYYFQETQAPAGYDKNDTKVKFKVEAPVLTLGGGLTSVTTSAGQTITAEEGEVFVAGPTNDKSPDMTLTATNEEKIKAITITYSKLEQTSGAAEAKHTFTTVAEAEADLNAQKNANAILGEVEIAVLYDADKTSTAVSHSDVKTPESSTPESSTPESSTPESSTPESSTPESSTPESSTPESSTPESSTPESSTPESSTPESSTPESSTPESSTPESSTPESSTPESSTPESSTPESSTPESSTPESSTPESSTPESSTPESSTPEEPSTPDTSSTPESSVSSETSSEPAASDSSESSSKSNTPQTGDSSKVILYLLLLFVAVAGFAVVIIVKKRKDKH